MMINENEKLKLVHEHKNLIYKIASKYSKYYPMEDLFQVGVIGVIKAIDNYDKSKDAKFSTYAFKYILGEIIKFVSHDRTIKVSSDLMKIYKSYEKSRDYLISSLGKVPSFLEVCNFMGVDSSIVKDAIETCEYSLSLDAVIGEDEFTLENVIGSDSREQIDNNLDLQGELDKLTDDERKLIELRYFRDYTQSETANYLGWNQVQVSRYESKILKKMKTNIVA